MITAHHLVFGKNYSGIIKVPFMNCNRFRMYFSTRNKNIIIKGLDGIITNYTTPKNFDFTSNSGSSFQITTSTTYSGDLEITTLGGNSDVYSIGYNWANDVGNDNFNIQDLGDFYSQFPNLYSILYGIYAYGDASRQPTFKGSLIKFGNSVRRCKIQVLDILNRVSNTYVNVNEINSSSQLEWFEHNIGYQVNYSGDLSKLPPNIYYFVAGASSSSSLTYTAGKTWASSFDTLNLGNAKISEINTDSLLIDMNNSITTAIGSKIINLANCARRPFSNKAISELQAKGFTVTTNGVIKFVGDLATIPLSIDNFVLVNNSSSDLITYTAGRSWVSSFDALNLGNAKLSLTDTDNLLIDMNNSITTAIGSKIINLANCVRSTASNAAVSGLQSKGFTVTVGLAQQFTFDLGQNVTINGSVTRAEGHDGRLNAIQFGSGNLVSADNLPISDVWSVAFWMKTTQTATCKVMELTANANNLAGFYLDNNGFTGGRFTTIIKNSNYNLKTSASVVINNGSWNHFVVIMNRAETTQNEIKVYINKILQTDATHPSFSTDSTGNFVSDKLYIGGRGTNYQTPFNGVLSPIKAFNYPLSQTEIDNLYNE